MTDSGQYKDTINLPQTRFDMRANATVREPEIQKFWSDHRIYEHLATHNPGDPFVLHDGPPYANGTLHMGHALNKVLKDIINRFHLMQGRKVRYVPGWDCHGLPIELKVLQTLKPEEKKNLTPLDIRRKARDFALATIAEQKQGFQRYGVWGDWDNPYITLTPAYEAAQIGVFGQMVLKGHIYRGLKPVYWSPSSKTALAEAELEYPEGHTSRSIYVGFPLVAHLDMPDVLRSLMHDFGDLKVAIWTTTPWTIPANLGVSVNPDLDYAVVEVGHEFQPKTKYLIVAAAAVERLSATLGTSLTVMATIPGKALEHLVYRHPLYSRESPILLGGDWITTDSGTGLVHTAPGHGQEDYLVGQRYGLPLLSPVDDDGNFTAEAGSQFQGLNVLKEGNTAVIEALAAAGALLKEEAYVHKYPYDWRTKKPVIYRATEQWFASIAGFREAALKAIADVQWIPAQGENRITPMVAERSDWCISRQRSWGVPIPVFYDDETGEPLLNAETIAHVQQLIAQHGSDIWWELPVDELLPPAYRANGRTYRKGTDIMDVWF
ncbi:MAG: isoleucine--tRNA ligase, partial [Cyanobacteria bacterium]|nr:isoleucine--tRNA ligase [Cyanobacteriota bacterium]MDW8201286.1 isoleucine--tRNA ligase [Cyanobacteriota bacterium SKYGB_h_bin112]